MPKDLPRSCHEMVRRLRVSPHWACAKSFYNSFGRSSNVLLEMLARDAHKFLCIPDHCRYVGGVPREVYGVCHRRTAPEATFRARLDDTSVRFQRIALSSWNVIRSHWHW